MTARTRMPRAIALALTIVTLIARTAEEQLRMTFSLLYPVAK